MAALRAGELPGATTQLTDVARRWSSAPAGNVAQVLAAQAELRRGNYDSALLLIQKSHDFFDGRAPYLKQELLFAWGHALEQRGAWTEAAEKYASAATAEGPFSGPALLGEARVREMAGEQQKALELYASYVDRFPDSFDHDIVRQKLGPRPEVPPAGDSPAR